MNPESTDTIKLTVARIPTPGGSHRDGLHWFRVEFGDCKGRCFITTGEAQHLRQLTAGWVASAVLNVASQRGLNEVKLAATRSPGLMLHHSDARDGSFY